MHEKQDFYGTTTIGAKGQVVIPAQARIALKLKKGDKLLVFSMGNDMLALTKLENLVKFEQHMANRLKVIRKVARSVK